MNDTEPSEIPAPGVVRRETCSLAVVRRVAAMLDDDPDRWSEGDVLPRGWQFILLGADTKRSALRHDGFPGFGVPLPDLGLPRLMLGSRTVRFDGDIHVGAVLRRESRVAKLTRKETANGPMAIVSVEHILHEDAAPAPVLTETQTYLLMGASTGDRQPSAGKAAAAIAPSAAAKSVVADDTLLFQYSALGFNSHRIHIDRDFARNVEGFPDLVVNGGLATLLLTEFFRTDLGCTPASLTARHLAPLFSGRPILLGAERQDDKWLLRAFDELGRLAVDIVIET